MAGLWAASFDNISYTYDENGIRASKTVGGKTTYFYVNGSQLFEQVNARDCGLHFFYDRNNRIIGFDYCGQTYYFIKSLQKGILAPKTNKYNSCFLIKSGGHKAHMNEKARLDKATFFLLSEIMWTKYIKC